MKAPDANEILRTDGIDALRAAIDNGTNVTGLPENLTAALATCRRLVTAAKGKDKAAALHRGAAGAFRAVSQDMPELFENAIDTLYAIANINGMIDDNATQKILDAALIKPEPDNVVEDRPQQQRGNSTNGSHVDPPKQSTKPRVEPIGQSDAAPPPKGPDDYGTTTTSAPALAKIDLAATFIFLGDAPAAAPVELIRNHLPAYGVAITGGQSTAGKTFVSIHKAICMATGLAYFGYKIVERVGTAYIAAEGRGAINNRFAAALAKHSITDKLPIAWIRQLPDFASTDGVKLFIRQMKELDKQFRGDLGLRLGHITLDTVAAGFAMKDEDDNSETTRVCNVMRRIGEETEALFGAVHHYGKNPESGLRGASAWKGSADVIEGVLADIDPLSGKASNRELVCTKARDGEQGPVSPFELQFVELGLNEDREVYGSCCIIPTPGASRFDKTKAVNKGPRAIEAAIQEVLNGAGQIIVPRADMPPVKAAKIIDIRKEFDRFYVVADDDPDKAADAKRMAFKRALDRLPLSRFGCGSADGADWIWSIKQ